MAKALAIAIFLLLVSSVVITAAEKPAESTLLPTSPPPHVHPPLRSIPRSLLSLSAAVGKLFINKVPSKVLNYVKEHPKESKETVENVMDVYDKMKDDDLPKPNSVPFSSPSPIAHYYISFEGFVSVKSCKYANSPNIPVRGAVVRLKCNGEIFQSPRNTTLQNGHFYLEAPKNINTNGPHNCIVFVLAPNSALCTPLILKSGGVNGANMTLQKIKSHGAPFQHYNVGTLAFCCTLN